MDRKALVREYKENRRPVGIFRVHNKLNDKSFVGKSVDLPSMLNRQQSQLRMGGHMNKALQKDWNEFGAEAFEFDVLDTLTIPEGANYDPTADLRALEELWMDNLKPFGDRGYNSEPKRAVE